MAGAAHASGRCASRSRLQKDLLVLLAQNLATGLPAYEAWRAAVYSTILQPIGLPADATLYISRR